MQEAYAEECGSEAVTLAELYPYFFNTYPFGAIITQCCDLEYKSGSLNVDCIQISAVIPFQFVLDRFLRKEKIVDDAGKVKSTDKNLDKISNELTRFLNHNTKLYFFYPPKEALEVEAALRIDVSIPLRESCYAALKKARVSSVSDAYRYKLGFKLAELYGRIGIDDFKTVVMISKGEFATKLKAWMHTKIKV